MSILLILLYNRNVEYIDTLEEMIIDARYENFRKQFNMNWTIYARAYDTYPMLFDDVKYILMSYGGVAPIFDGISIRGGAPSDNLITIDGIPLITPLYRFLNFLPVDRDAVQTAQFYRGDMPIRYDGMLSAVLRINTSRNSRYVKVGLPSAGIKAKGFLLDYFLPSLLTTSTFGWKSHLGLYSGEHFSILAMDCLRYFETDMLIGGDSVKSFRDYMKTIGGSINGGPLEVAVSVENRIMRGKTSDSGWISFRQRNALTIATLTKGPWGLVFQHHYYSSPDIPDSLYREMGAARQFYSIHGYREIGPLSIGFALLSQGIAIPIIRIHYKHFLNGHTAFRIFLGNTFQGYMSMDYPFFLRFALKDRINRGYTATAGLERVDESRTIEAEAYIRVVYPYYAIYPFQTEDPVGDSIAFPHVGMLAAGVDFSMEDIVNRYRFSITLQRSLIFPGWYSAPGDIRFAFTLQYRYVSAFYVDGPIRSDIASGLWNPRPYRESAMYIIAFHYPFEWKGFHFRVGIYNVMPQPQPEGEFSSIYRAFPIPILSVKKEF